MKDLYQQTAYSVIDSWCSAVSTPLARTVVEVSKFHGIDFSNPDTFSLSPEDLMAEARERSDIHPISGKATPDDEVDLIIDLVYRQVPKGRVAKILGRGERTIYKVLDRWYENEAKDLHEKRDRYFGEIISEYRGIARDAKRNEDELLKAGKFRSAQSYIRIRMDAMHEIAKLTGMEKPRQVEVSGRGGGPIETLSAIAVLGQKLRELNPGDYPDADDMALADPGASVAIEAAAMEEYVDDDED